MSWRWQTVDGFEMHILLILPSTFNSIESLFQAVTFFPETWGSNRGQRWPNSNAYILFAYQNVHIDGLEGPGGRTEVHRGISESGLPRADSDVVPPACWDTDLVDFEMP